MRVNTLMRNNRSGVPGVRPRLRRNKYGREALELDVSWMDRTTGRRRTTSYPLDLKAPVACVARALTRRHLETGVEPPLTPRAAWLRLRKALPAPHVAP
jgi:hypothetical protein